MNAQLIEAGIEAILQGLGIDLTDRNFVQTPKRFAKLLAEMFDPGDVEIPVYPETYDGIVIVRHHTTYTLCPHHLLPVHLDISLAYNPNGHVVGLSKLPRLVADINRRPMLQEELTRLLVERLDTIKDCLGAAALIVGTHGCMQIRGVRTNADTITTHASGMFQEATYWDNFCRLVGHR